VRAQIQQQFRPRDQITALYSFIANKLEIPQLVREDHLYFSACCVSQLYISQTPQGPEPGDPRRNIELHTNGDERPLLSINFECLRAFTYKIEMRQQQKRHCRTKNNYFFGVFSVKLFSFGRTQKHRKSQLYRRKIGTFTHSYQIRTSIKFTRNAPGTLTKSTSSSLKGGTGTRFKDTFQQLEFQRNKY